MNFEVEIELNESLMELVCNFEWNWVQKHRQAILNEKIAIAETETEARKSSYWSEITIFYTIRDDEAVYWIYLEGMNYEVK